MNLPIIKTIKPKISSSWNGAWKAVTDIMYTSTVRQLSKTIRVVEDSSFVTDTPAKLKNAIENVFPKKNSDK